MPTHLPSNIKKAIKTAIDSGDYDAIRPLFYNKGTLVYPLGLGSIVTPPSGWMKRLKSNLMRVAVSRFGSSIMGLGKDYGLLKLVGTAQIEKVLSKNNEEQSTVLDWLTNEVLRLEYLRSLENHYRMIKKINQALSRGTSLETMRTTLILLGNEKVDPNKDYPITDDPELRRIWTEQLIAAKRNLKSKLPTLRASLYIKELESVGRFRAVLRAFLRFISPKPTGWAFTYRAQKLSLWCKENVQAELREDGEFEAISINTINKRHAKIAEVADKQITWAKEYEDEAAKNFADSLSASSQEDSYLESRHEEIKKLVAIHVTQLKNDLIELNETGFGNVSDLQIKLLTQLKMLVPNDSEYPTYKTMVMDRSFARYKGLINRYTDLPDILKDEFYADCAGEFTDAMSEAAKLRFVEEKFKTKLDSTIPSSKGYYQSLANPIRSLWHIRLLIRCHFGLNIYSTIASLIKPIGETMAVVWQQATEANEQIDTLRHHPVLSAMIGSGDIPNPRKRIIEMAEKCAPTDVETKRNHRIVLQQETSRERAEAERTAYENSKVKFLNTLSNPTAYTAAVKTIDDTSLKPMAPKSAAQIGAAIFHTEPVHTKGKPEKAIITRKREEVFTSAQQTISNTTEVEVATQAQVTTSATTTRQVVNKEYIVLPNPPVQTLSFNFFEPQAFISSIDSEYNLQITAFEDVDSDQLQESVNAFHHTALLAIKQNIENKNRVYFNVKVNCVDANQRAFQLPFEILLDSAVDNASIGEARNELIRKVISVMRGKFSVEITDCQLELSPISDKDLINLSNDIEVRTTNDNAINIPKLSHLLLATETFNAFYRRSKLVRNNPNEQFHLLTPLAFYKQFALATAKATACLASTLSFQDHNPHQHMRKLLANLDVDVLGIRKKIENDLFSRVLQQKSLKRYGLFIDTARSQRPERQPHTHNIMIAFPQSFPVIHSNLNPASNAPELQSYDSDSMKFIDDLFEKMDLLQSYQQTFSKYLQDQDSLYTKHGLWSNDSISDYAKAVLNRWHDEIQGYNTINKSGYPNKQFGEILQILQNLQGKKIESRREKPPIDIDISTLLMIAPPRFDAIPKYAHFLTQLSPIETEWLLKIYNETAREDLSKNLPDIQDFFLLVRMLGLTLPNLNATEAAQAKGVRAFQYYGFHCSRIIYIKKILGSVDRSRAQHYLNNIHNIPTLCRDEHPNEWPKEEQIEAEAVLRQRKFYFFDYRILNITPANITTIHRYESAQLFLTYPPATTFPEPNYFSEYDLYLGDFMAFVSMHYPNMRIDKDDEGGTASPDEFAEFFLFKMDELYKTHKNLSDSYHHFREYMLAEMYHEASIAQVSPEQPGVIATLFAIRDLNNEQPIDDPDIRKLLTLHYEYKLVCSKLASLQNENREIDTQILLNSLRDNLQNRKDEIEVELRTTSNAYAEQNLVDKLPIELREFYGEYQSITDFLDHDSALLELRRTIIEQATKPLEERISSIDLVKALVAKLQTEYRNATSDLERKSILLKFLGVSFFVESQFEMKQTLRPVQLLSILYALKYKKLMSEIDTGEGKTTTIRHIAFANAFMGLEYDVFTHTEVASKHDAAEAQSLAKYLGFSVGTLNNLAEEFARKDRVKDMPQIVFGAVMPFAIYNRQRELFNDGPLAKRQCKNAAGDEGDDIALDYSATTTGILPSDAKGTLSDDLKILYRAVNIAAQELEGKYTATELKQAVNSKLKEWDKKFNFDEEPTFAQAIESLNGISLESWITMWYDAIQAANNLKEGDDFILEKESTRLRHDPAEQHNLLEVQMMNPLTSGERGLGSMWALNVHQLVADRSQWQATLQAYAQASEALGEPAEMPFVLEETPIVHRPPLQMPKAEVGVPTFFRGYDHLTLFSATLGDENERERTTEIISADPDEVRIFKFPRHTSQRRYDFRPLLAATEQENCELLLASIFNARGQAVRGRKNKDGSYNWIAEALPFTESNAHDNPNAHDWYAENASKSAVITFKTVEELHAFSSYLSENGIMHNTMDDTNDDEVTPNPNDHGDYARKLRTDLAHESTYRPGEITLATPIGGRAINFKRVGLIMNAKLRPTIRGVIQNDGRSGRKYLMGQSATAVHVADAGVTVGTESERKTKRDAAFKMHHRIKLTEAIKRANEFVKYFNTQFGTHAHFQKMLPFISELSMIISIEESAFNIGYKTLAEAHEAIQRWDGQIQDFSENFAKKIKRFDLSEKDSAVLKEHLALLDTNAVTDKGLDIIDQQDTIAPSLLFFGKIKTRDPIADKQSTTSLKLVEASKNLDRSAQVNESFQFAFADLCKKIACNNKRHFAELWKTFSDFYPRIASLAKLLKEGKPDKTKMTQIWEEMVQKVDPEKRFVIQKTPMEEFDRMPEPKKRSYPKRPQSIKKQS